MKLKERLGKKTLAGAVILAAVIGGIAVWGKDEIRNGTRTPVESNGAVHGMSGDEAAAQKSTESGDVELPVNQEEAELISQLYGALNSRSYVEAARIMNNHEAVFEVLINESLNGERYCYFEEKTTDGNTIPKLEKLSSDKKIEGLVLTRYNTAFYGEFEKGKPNGSMNAIQTMILDEPRYTFAEGQWLEGKMNGEGRTGYHYYENAPESGFVYTEKKGKYKNDQLDGVFSYRTESGGGETLTWEIRAVNGATVLTEEWTHYPFRKEYMLASKESKDRAYVLSEERASAVIWNNLIRWDE